MSAATPLISVLMPIYNAEPYLQAAIQSILTQTLGDFELLAMDDGSTDRSWSIIQQAAAADARILAQRFPHAGYASLLNHGLSSARGRYIARMDADDISHPARFEKQVAFLEIHPAVHVVGTQYRRLHEGKPSADITRLPTEPAAVSSELERTSCLAHPTVMMRTGTIRKLQGYRKQFLPAEDYDLWLRTLSAHGDSIANLPEPLLDYRVHQGQISTRKVMDQIIHTQAALVAYQYRARGQADPFEDGQAITLEKVASLTGDKPELVRRCLVGLCARIVAHEQQSGSELSSDPLVEGLFQFAKQHGQVSYARAQLSLARACADQSRGVGHWYRWFKALTDISRSPQFIWRAVHRITSRRMTEHAS